MKMRLLVVLPLLMSVSLIASPQSGKPDSADSSPVKSGLAADYGKLPLSFEANRGQVDPQVRFTSRGNGYSLFLTDSEAVLALSKGDHADLRHPGIELGKGDAAKPGPLQTDVVRMQLAGVAKGVKVEGAEQLPGTANYFIGNDPAKWHSNVPTFGKVKYSGVYPGVDLVYYGNQRQLEYDFVVAPGADPKQVKLHFVGASKVRLTADGDLEIVGKNGEIAFHKPVVYQVRASKQVSESASRLGPHKPGRDLNGESKREPVGGRFVLLAGNTVGFRVGSYDKGQDLVIDPTLAYSTYLGGSGGATYNNGDHAYGIALDSTGNAYIVGTTESLDFPVSSNAFQKVNQAQFNNTAFGARHTANVFITKLNPTGAAIVYSTYLGGTGDYYFRDYGQSIAVNSAGEAFVTGYTGSGDFPLTANAYQKTNKARPNGEYTAFVTRLNASGSGLIYSTYLGGSGWNISPFGSGGDIGSGIALDAGGNAIVTGLTFSADFPVTSGAFQTVNPAAGIKGTGVYSNYTFNRSVGFVTKLDGAGDALIYSTYLGGTGNRAQCCSNFSVSDGGSGITVDGLGNAYITGYAHSKDFPVTSGAIQSTNNAHNSLNGTGAADSNVFVTKLNPAGSALVYSTYLGGSGNQFVGDQGTGIAVDPSCYAYVTGQAASADFPTTASSFQPGYKENPNGISSSTDGLSAFVSRLNTTGTALDYSTYLSGTGQRRGYGEIGNAISVDATGHAVVVGYTISSDYPVTAGAFQTMNNQSVNQQADYYSGNAFLTRLSSAGSALSYSTFFGGTGSTQYGGDTASAVAIDPAGNAYFAGATYSDDLPVSMGAFQRKNQAIAAGNPASSNAFVTKLNIGSGIVLEPTAISLTSNANPSGVDGKVTFTAFVHANDAPCAFPPTGYVNFSVDGGAPVKVYLSLTAHAAYSTSTLTAGKHTVVATYPGDSKDAASTSATLTETVVDLASSIALYSGAGQTAAVGTAFARPLVVVVKDSKGSPVAGATVTFVGEGVSVSAASAVTNSSGLASVMGTPTQQGSVAVKATVAGVATGATFYETGTAAAAASIAVYSGAGQAAAVGTAFAKPLVAVVKDSGGHAVSGATVSFVGEGVSVSVASAVTNSSGLVSVTGTPMRKGSVAVKATVAGGSLAATFYETGQ